MKQNMLSHTDIARVCRELAVLLHAGMLLGDGLSLLASEESGELGVLLSRMGQNMDEGNTLASAMKNTGCFPAYVTGLVEVGERTGRTEQALQALAHYYDQRERMDRQLRAALTYPAILLMLMLVVIVVLLTKVLPIFDEVYASLGGQLTGIAGGMLAIGRALDIVMPLLCVFLALAAGFVVLFSSSTAFRSKLLSLWHKSHGDKGISRKLNEARFAQALAMGLHSGLPMEESISLCATLLFDVPEAVERCETCVCKLGEGADLAQALKDCDLLPASACKMLELGMRSGIGDSVMDDIAQRLSEDADEALARRAGIVEPALVLVCTLLVGSILLSVMLPLMNIMSVIG